MPARENTAPHLSQEQQETRVSRTERPTDLRLHLPEEDVPNRPQLKVKPIGSRTDAAPSKPSVRAGTLFGKKDPKEDSRAEAPTIIVEPKRSAPSPQQAPHKKVVLPPAEQRDVRSAFATHRPAPPDERAEKEELAAVTGDDPAPQVSTGFVLGLALIVVVLVGGVLVARLGKRVHSLERRVRTIETADTETALAGRPAP